MDSEPQPFSWPGIAVNSSRASEQPCPPSLDPAQAAADAAAAGHQQGFDRGYAEGLAKGEQDAQAQMQQQLDSLQAVFTEAEVFAQQWRSTQVELVQLIGAKFLLQELVADSDRLARLLEQGRALLPTLGDFSVACHPELEAQLAQQTQYNLIADPQLPSGALELRQGYSCLQFDINAVVAEAFSNLDQISIAYEAQEPLAMEQANPESDT